MNNSLIDDAEALVHDRFARFPHFSFGDGSIMANHTIAVHRLAKEIAKTTTCNTLVVELCALFHDIGKTIVAEMQTLEREHEALGWPIAREFLQDRIGKEDLRAIQLFFEDQQSIERTIVKDADILAFYSDLVLQEAFVAWANYQGRPELIRKKWDKYNKITLAASKVIGDEMYLKSRSRWFPDTIRA